MNTISKWVFYAFILMILIVILSRSSAFTKSTGAVVSGSNTLIRALTGQNSSGNQFIPSA